MDEQAYVALSRRVDHLERQCRRWKWVGWSGLTAAALILAAVIGPVAGRASEPQKSGVVLPAVVAQSFVVVGKDQKPRAMLGLEPNGSAALELRDQQSRVRSRIGMDGDFATLELRDVHDTVHAALSVGPDGQTLLSCSDAPDRPRCMIRVAPDGPAGVVLFGSDGKDRAKFVLLKDGTARFVFMGRNGKARLAMGISAEDAASFTAYSKDEEVRVAAGIRESDDPVFSVMDKAGKQVGGMPEKQD